MKQTDLTFIDDCIFTTFLPETKAGEFAWKEAASKNGGVFKILKIHKESAIYQLKKAGYTVTKAKKSKLNLSDIFDDELLENLV